MVCFPITFIYLFKELQYLLGLKIKTVKWKMTLYCVLMSLVMIIRFVYFLVMEILFKRFNSEEEKKPDDRTFIDCANLIPSYLTEICFSIFVIIHIYAEGSKRGKAHLK